MPDTPRINVTPASAAHAELLKYWSVLTGRSASSLCSSLLEETLNKKLEDGAVHPTAVRLMEEVIKNREALLKFDHKQNLKFEQIRADQEYIKLTKDGENNQEGLEETLSTKPLGEFTDIEWGNEKKLDIKNVSDMAEKIFKLYEDSFSERVNWQRTELGDSSPAEQTNKNIKRNIFDTLNYAKNNNFDLGEIYIAIKDSKSFVSDTDAAGFITDLIKSNETNETNDLDQKYF